MLKYNMKGEHVSVLNGNEKTKPVCAPSMAMSD